MNKTNRMPRLAAILLVLVMLLGLLPTTAFASGADDITAKEANISACLEATKAYLTSLTQGNNAVVGSTGGEWWVLSMARADLSPKSGFYCRYLSTVKDYVTNKINAKEQLHSAKSTDNSRVILALVAIGADPTDAAGHNLLEGLTSMKYVKKQGINGPIWALIALDSHNFEIPTAADPDDQVTRDKLIEYTLSKQLENGGWALSGTNADPDMTAMAIQSLAPYYSQKDTVRTAVDKALACLSLLQQVGGGYASWGTVNSESCAQVVVALTALGIDPTSDSRFVKDGNSVVDALCAFAVEGGGFRHTMDGTLNGMATEQGAYALAAYELFKQSKTSLYDMSDVAALRTDVHVWDAGVVTKPATYSEKGEKTYTCIGCGDTKVEEIPVAPYPTVSNGGSISQPSETQAVKSPKTGDDAYPQVYLPAFACSALCLIFMVQKKKEAR